MILGLAVRCQVNLGHRYPNGNMILGLTVRNPGTSDGPVTCVVV